MARTIDEIYNSIMTEKATKPELDVLNSASRVATYKMWIYIISVTHWIMEKSFDLLKTEVDEKIQKQRFGKRKWYQLKGLAFQYGQELPEDSDEYDNTGLTDAEIEAKKIIKYCSVTEIDGKLRIKVAKQVGGLPAQLTEGELAAFKEYMELIKFAGVKLIIDSLPADNLKLELDIFFDPLVIRADGSRIDGSSATPVKDAIKEYLNALPFNGEYANTRLTNKLETVSGIVLPVIKSAQAKYGLFAFTVIDEKYIPDAGYLTITDENLTINFREYVQS